MSIARLRRILATPLEITVESTPALVASVAAAAVGRAHLNPKTAAVYAPLAGSQGLSFQPIDLLRKIGELTTPKGVNLARLSASWATRRYFWAIQDGTRRRFRISDEARTMDRHQKTLLSDEFGMGFAGLVAERLLGTTQFVDVDFAVSNPASYFGARALVSRRPDFIMWAPGTPIFIIECKGSQTARSAVIGQLRRGLEQLPSIDIGRQAKVSLVVATHMRTRDASIFVLDPPDDGPDQGPRHKVDSSIDQIGKDKFVVSDVAGFQEKLRVGADLTRLRWAGQHAAASELERTISGGVEQLEELDAPLERLETAAGAFLGTATPAAPELGPGGPRIFRGVRDDFIAGYLAGARARAGDTVAHEQLHAGDPRLSVGSDGICLSVLGLDM